MTKIWFVYCIRFLSNFCQAAFFPFFAVWLMKTKLFSSSEAALIVSIGILSTRLSGLFFSNLIQQFHKKNIINFALVLVSLFYGAIYGLYYVHNDNVVIWSFISLSIGSALSLNSLALLSYLALTQEDNKHHDNFSLINIALNLSSGIGPLLAAMILMDEPRLFPVVPIFFSISALFFSSKLDKDMIQISQKNKAEVKVIEKSNYQYWYFMILNLLTFIGYAQFYDVFPLYASHFLSSKTIGWLFVLSSVVIVLLQMMMSRLCEKIARFKIILISHLLLAYGTLLFSNVAQGNQVYCFIGVIFISIAEILYAPLYQTIAIQLYQPKNPVFSLAFQSFVWGVSEAFATYLGINLIGRSEGAWSFYVGTFCALLVGLMAVVFFNNKKVGMQFSMA